MHSFTDSAASDAQSSILRDFKARYRNIMDGLQSATDPGTLPLPTLSCKSPSTAARSSPPPPSPCCDHPPSHPPCPPPPPPLSSWATISGIILFIAVVALIYWCATRRKYGAKKVKNIRHAKDAKELPSDGFAFFHAKWCGHCKEMLPVLTECAKKYKGTGEIIAVEHSVIKDSGIIEALGIQGFPCLVAYKKGKPVAKLSGGRKAPDIDNFLASHS